MELENLTKVDLVIDASKIVNISKKSKLKKSHSFEKKNAGSLSRIMTSVIEIMLKDQEAQKITTPLSMSKLRGKLYSWLKIYLDQNKGDKSARLIDTYGPVKEIIIQVLKDEEIIVDVEGGFQVDIGNLAEVSAKVNEVPDDAYFVPYFQSIK